MCIELSSALIPPGSWSICIHNGGIMAAVLAISETKNGCFVLSLVLVLYGSCLNSGRFKTTSTHKASTSPLAQWLTHCDCPLPPDPDYIRVLLLPGTETNLWAHVLFAPVYGSDPHPVSYTFPANGLGWANHNRWSNIGRVWYPFCTEKRHVGGPLVHFINTQMFLWLAVSNCIQGLLICTRC